MRILVVSNLYPPHTIGGYEERCKDVVDALRARGHTLQVLTSSYGLAAPADEGQINRTLRFHWTNPVRSLPGLALAEWRDQQTVRDVIRQRNPDLVFVWSLRSLSSSVLSVLSTLCMPVVYDISDEWLLGIDGARWVNFWRGIPQKAWKQRAKKILAAAIRQMVPVKVDPPNLHNAYFASRNLRGRYAAAGYPVADSRIIYCGIPTQQFQYRAQRRADGAPLRMLYVGQISGDKGVLTVVEALAELDRRGCTAVQLTLVGKHSFDKGFLDRLQAMIVTANLQARVHYQGQLPRAQMPNVYHAHDVLVFPTITEEPFALVPLEAMACGIPVIATTTGGTRELVTDGENALVFPAGDATALADRLHQLSSDAALRERLRKNARALVSARYDVTQMVDQIEGMLLQTAGTANRAHRSVS
jgi:glycogen(starch) synthase